MAPAAKAGIPPSCVVVENRGQLPESVRCYSCGEHATIYFTAAAVVIDLPEQSRAIWMRLEGGSQLARIELVGERQVRLNYFLGSDPEHWRADIRTYGEVVYRDAWPGIDLRFQPRAEGLGYEIVTHAGADRERARFRFDGMEGAEPGLLLDQAAGPDGGSRVLCWDAGALDPPPEGSGDPSDPTRDDPASLLWGTLIGGSDNEYAHGLTHDALGNPIVAGYTRSGNFPTTVGAYDRTLGGSYDVFLAKFDAQGSSLIWATFIGGGLEDRPFGVVRDHGGNLIVAGLTYSTDFPTTTGAYDRTLGGERDCFVTKINSSGSALWWSTYLGGGGLDRVWDVVLDGSDRPVLSGETFSSDFPTTAGAYDTSPNGSSDAFVTKVSAQGSDLLWSTYLGGSLDDQLTFLDIGPEEQAILVGNSSSPNYPTTPGAFDPSHNGGEDCIVTSLSADGDSLLYSTFLGGGGAEWGNVIAVDASGQAMVTGSTTSVDYPVTPLAYDRSHNGNRDLFVTRLDSRGASLVGSSFVGGISTDEPFALVLDETGCPILSGEVSSFDFPTTPNAFDRTYGGSVDAFLTRMTPSCSALLWSSFVGGSDSDGGWELALDASGDPFLTGPTRSADFPTTAGAYDVTHNGGKDVFLVRFHVSGAAGIEEMTSPRPPMRIAPNPFLGEVAIEIGLPQPGNIEVLALDGQGRVVTRLRDGFHGAGVARLAWDGRDARGRSVPSGVYWLRIRTDEGIVHKKLIRVR